MTLSPSNDVRSSQWWRWWRLGGVCGIVFFVLFIVGGVGLQGEPPAFDKPISEILDFFSDKGSQYLIGDYLLGFAFWFGFLPFAICLGALLGQVEGGPQIASRLVLAGGLATVLVGEASTIFSNALGLDAIEPGIPESAAQGLLYEHAVAIAALGMPASLLVFAASWAIWSTGVLWRWLAIIAALDGVLLAIGSAFPIEGEGEGILFVIRFISFIGLALWVVLTSIGMLLRSESPTPHAP